MSPLQSEDFQNSLPITVKPQTKLSNMLAGDGISLFGFQ